MNGKIVSAFIAGAVIASGIVYMAVRPGSASSPAKVGDVNPAPPAAPTVLTPPAPVVAQSELPVKQTPIREKPSPMPPPAPREKPVVVARNHEQAAAPPIPAPQPAPTPVQPETKPSDSPPATPGEAPPPPPEPVPAAPPAPAQTVEPPPPETRVPHTVTLAAGTVLPVRIGETISSARNQPGESFLATLEQPLVIDGFIIAERGARAEGRIVEAEAAGRGRGLAHLGIELVRLSTSDGQRIRIRTEPYRKDGPSSTGSDAAKIGAGAAIGAAIGAIAGGGKGAAIGAGVGGAAGAGDVLLTRGKPAEIPVETRLTFRVQEPVSITEKLD